MTLHKLDATLIFEGKEYHLRVSVQAPKEQADIILQQILRILIKRGLIKND